jgi:hypothetical protein
LPVILALWFTMTRSWRRDAAWFFGPLLLLALHSILHGWFITRPYFSLMTSAGAGTLLATPLQRAGFAVAGAAGLSLALIALWLSRRPAQRDGLSARFAALTPIMLRTGAIAVILLALFAYFVRPNLEALRFGSYWYGGGELPALDRENMVRLGWYLSPIGLALGVAGVAWLLNGELNRKTAFLLAAGSFFAVVYLWRISANPHQVYAMRRYVPQVAPFLVVAATYFIQRLYAGAGTPRRQVAPRRWVAIGLTAIWIISIVLPNQPFLRQVDYEGLARQLDRLNSALPRKAVVLFNDPAPVGIADFVGTPLRFLYGRPVFLLRQGDVDAAALRDALDAWRGAGYEVVLLETHANQPWPLAPETLGPPENHRLTFDHLENTYESKPTRVIAEEWAIAIRPVNPTRGSE